MVMLKVGAVVRGCYCDDESEDGSNGEESIRRGGDDGEVMVVVVLKLVKMVELSLEYCQRCRWSSHRRC